MAVQADQERYLGLNGKYLNDAEALLSKKDYSQASEKFWGACAEMVKAVAARRGTGLGSHRSLGEFVAVLDRERPGWELLRLFNAANSLHANFYEDWLPPEAVDDGAEAVREMVQRLRGLL